MEFYGKVGCAAEVMRAVVIDGPDARAGRISPGKGTKILIDPRRPCGSGP